MRKFQKFTWKIQKLFGGFLQIHFKHVDSYVKIREEQLSQYLRHSIPPWIYENLWKIEIFAHFFLWKSHHSSKNEESSPVHSTWDSAPGEKVVAPGLRDPKLPPAPPQTSIDLRLSPKTQQLPLHTKSQLATFLFIIEKRVNQLRIWHVECLNYPKIWVRLETQQSISILGLNFYRHQSS